MRGHVGGPRQQTRYPLPRPGLAQDRPFSVARLGRDLDLDPVSIANRGLATQGQKSGRIACPQVDKGPAQPRRHLGDTPDTKRAQPVLRHVAVTLDQKVFRITVTEDHAPGFAGHDVEEDLDGRAHDRRQPMPDSRLTVSGRGRPITAGWLPTMRTMKAPAGPWMP